MYQNAKDSIGNMKDKMFQMKNRINELNDDLASSTGAAGQIYDWA